MAQTHDHEIVSIYPFSESEVDQLMNASNECVLMWATKDGWPVGVTHAFVWHDGKIWLTFAAHRHRAEAIKRDDRVSVNVSSGGYPRGAPATLPDGAITFKGRAEFHDDEQTRHWFYTALSKKLNPRSVLWDRDVLVERVNSAQREIVAQVLSYGVGGHGTADSTLHRALSRTKPPSIPMCARAMAPISLSKAL